MEKPSFFESLKAGVIGMVKGALMLGAVAFCAGGAIGALLGTGAPLTAALAGATAFANIGILVGAILGAATGIVQSRERGITDPQDLVNLANISFAQGVSVGKNQNVQEPSKEEVVAAAKAHFQNKLANEKPSCGCERG